MLRLLLVILFLSNSSFAEKEFGIQSAVSLTTQQKIRSVDKFLESLPASLKENWIPAADSASAQEGLKFLLRSKDSRFTMTFNMSPDAEGYDSVEMKEYSAGPPATFELAELRFEDDFQPTRFNGPRVRPPFENGVHVTRNAVNHPFLDSDMTCAECHAGGDSRFDLREVIGKQLNMEYLKKSQPQRWEELKALLSNPEAKRVKHLAKSKHFSELLKQGKPEPVFTEWKDSARKMSDELGTLNAKVIAEKIAGLISSKEPTLAVSMLAVLKGCDFSKIFTRAAWAQRMKYFQKPNMPFQDKDVAELKVLQWGEKEPFPPLVIVDKIKGKIDAERARYIPTTEVTDKATDTLKLSEFLFLFDEFVERGHDNQKNKLKDGDNIKVTAWSPNSTHHGYWFSEEFPKYERELTRLLGPLVTEHAHLPLAQQNCKNLEEASRESFAKMESAAQDDAHAPPLLDGLRH